MAVKKLATRANRQQSRRFPNSLKLFQDAQGRRLDQVNANKSYIGSNQKQWDRKIESRTSTNRTKSESGEEYNPAKINRKSAAIPEQECANGGEQDVKKLNTESWWRI